MEITKTSKSIVDFFDFSEFDENVPKLNDIHNNIEIVLELFGENLTGKGDVLKVVKIPYELPKIDSMKEVFNDPINNDYSQAEIIFSLIHIFFKGTSNETMDFFLFKKDENKEKQRILVASNIMKIKFKKIELLS